MPPADFAFLNVKAIVIACVGSFRQLFVTSQNQHQRRQADQRVMHRGLPLYVFSRTLPPKLPRSDMQWPLPNKKGGSETSIAPLGRTYRDCDLSVPDVALSRSKTDRHGYNVTAEP